MKRIALLLRAAPTVASVIVLTPPGTGHADQEAAPVFVTEIPSSYRSAVATTEAIVASIPSLWAAMAQTS